MAKSATYVQIRRALGSVSARLAQVQGDRSQRQFARDLGVFQQNVNRYMRGTTPHVEFVARLAIVEQISPSWLLLGRGPRKLRS